MKRLLLSLFLLLTSGLATAQSFGSSSDPMEQPRFLQRESFVVGSAYVGPAFVGDTWTAALSAGLEGGSNAWSFGVGSTLHSSPSELRNRETDEIDDVARVVRYLRHDATTELPVYARIGPLNHFDLGRGQLVKDFNTIAAWDERTLGAELALLTPRLRIGGFSSDLALDQVVGASAEVQPFSRDNNTLGSLTLGAGIVHDRSFHVNDAPTAIQFDASIDLAEYFEFAVSPFVSYAKFLNFGGSIGGGIEVGTDNLIGVAQTEARIGLFFSRDGFSQGYFGPHYAVSSGANRIIVADTFFDADEGTELIGVNLADVSSGVDLVTDLEVIVFGSFEASWFFRRHFGNDDLSQMSFRIASKPRFVDGLRVELSVERTGLGSFFSVFNDFKDQNSLVFEIDYPLRGATHLSLRSRYGYRRIMQSDTALETDIVGSRFLVERRFEPMLGIRHRW